MAKMKKISNLILKRIYNFPLLWDIVQSTIFQTNNRIYEN